MANPTKRKGGTSTLLVFFAMLILVLGLGLGGQAGIAFNAIAVVLCVVAVVLAIREYGADGKDPYA